MKIAFLGSRGIPARYGGFETFYEQISTRLVERGHEVTVYNRSHFIRDVHDTYRGVRLVTLPSIPTKHLDTITHTLLSSLHALKECYDVVYYCIVGNSPLVWLPRLRGMKTLLNVDGEDWAREKWSGFARWYQRHCERVAVKTANVIIADARFIRERYRERYHAESVFVPYGANLQRDEGTAALAKWDLRPGRYLLFVGRLVPENAAHLLIDAFKQIDTDMQLVILGDAPYAEGYKKELRASADRRVVFTGYAFGADYLQLSSHAYAYVLPSAVEGTRPALLDQMGIGNCVVARGSRVNREVLGDAGIFFACEDPLPSLVARLKGLLREPDLAVAKRASATERIEAFYNWEWITDFYEDLFRRLCAGRQLVSYDAFLSDRR